MITAATSRALSSRLVTPAKMSMIGLAASPATAVLPMCSTSTTHTLSPSFSSAPAAPLEVLDGKIVPLIELIAPVHQRVYKMGLEHLGVVVGDTFDAFVEAHKHVLTGQQFQGPTSTPDPVYILFEDFTHVKFYRLSLRASVELNADLFDVGFHHVDDWVPQRLVTATGPNPLPR